MHKASVLVAAAMLAAVATAGLAGPPTLFPPGAVDAAVNWTPSSPVTGQTVTFVISVRNPNGSITGVTLDYGDGTRDTLPTPHSAVQDVSACLSGGSYGGHLSHQFAVARHYDATLVVTTSSCPLSGSLDPQTSSWHYDVSVAAAH